MATQGLVFYNKIFTLVPAIDCPYICIVKKQNLFNLSYLISLIFCGIAYKRRTRVRRLLFDRAAIIHLRSNNHLLETDLRFT